jgi:predicted nucleotidyltransferase component of viral defense system
MIPKRYIQEWVIQAPWQLPDYIEQDLIISRALVALFSDDYLKENLVFRGGTALHKLFLNPAPRYSEDIDLVQRKEGPIKPILQRIEDVINFFDEPRVVKVKANNNTILYRFSSEFNPETRMKLKLEINCREHFHILPLQSIPFKVANGWFDGDALITTYDVFELLGTKIRALYQRSKGRDLFDLYYASQHIYLDYDHLMKVYQKYMKFVVSTPPSYKQFLHNINAKELSSEFLGDMEGLLRPGITYNHTMAFEWLKNEVLEKIKNFT